ncbi:MAG: xylan 1,4-beta-xylosidase [Oscillospiraceae bacterium]|nr:xylan 1,4-beta-xylosidase [Oscillospiraceae bacterium]
MAKKEKRFVKIFSQDMGSVQILVDKQTGVNYLWVSGGYSGGLTPLLNRDGTPVISALPVEDEKSKI